ncbi:hypothetical protein QBC47DRAFT_416237 [Echria macrotheca]|uniref:CMP/dCMP-type deaminase domain-containing protein n=1 Tax=Echria macrotheca TaxID=438768 RepID=A0AAJ0B6G7_9PEZI|nr:hypothetical protein QBC47DRAFT_416237 [Echria macrotheca]
MKNDQYLNLCLEQAAQSPLHFRHGSIVVKGGKVIGQGFNDYRRGFDGGSLKTGQLPTAAFPFDDAVVEFKRKRKSKRPDPATSTSISATFIPFERVSAGGGRHANTCLSMHSEMMAINSALAASSTLAASTASHFKPCFKLSGRNSKPRRLRGGNDAVKSYVERVCLEAMGSEVQRRTGAAVDEEWRFENQNQNLNGRKKNKGDEGKSLLDGHSVSGRTPPNKSISRGGMAKEPRVQNHVLLSKGRVNPARSLTDRMKHPKLVGADVYVARLSNSSPANPRKPVSDTLADGRVSTPTGSLHDELLCKTSPTRSTASVRNTGHLLSAVDSRPCYRCVSYMHSVGIKRVFWTNSDGDWEGAKVRDLVDVLDGTGDESEGAAGLGVFVTKHEVLMMRRLMGS